MVRKLDQLIVTVFGIGYSPYAPGTCGSLFGLALGSVLISTFSSHLPLWIAIGIVLCLSALFIPLYLKSHPGKKDPSEIVIDEVLGQLIALSFCHTGFEIMVAFVLFRLFDIWKPGPISWADKMGGTRLKETTGIILDDVLAGLYTLVILTTLKLLLLTL